MHPTYFMPSILLKPGRERSLLRHHPWIFSGAVDRLDGNPAPGETVDLLAADGAFLARAAYSPASQITARVWTFDPSEGVDAAFFRSRLTRAIQSRLAPSAGTNQAGRKDAARLVYAESEGFPGLIVDRYADVLVLQSLTAGSEYWKDTLADLLLELTGLQSIYERSDADVRTLEGLVPCTGVLRGSIRNLQTVISENDLQFHVNFQAGHKTGFYLDQSRNRLCLREYSEGRQVLDCFCYTGGFTVNALADGAGSVLSVDASADALELCRANVALNGQPEDRHITLEGDVFTLLRRFRDEARSFDMIILDPPKFAPTSAQAERAARGYKDINLLAFKLLRPGGILFTFSCSGGIDAALFQKIVASAALDAGVEAQVVEHLSQAPDHPVALNFPEGTYLKGLVCRKIS
jgi:23S rRNA (cytosine1962-C5)-methyltransferase